MKEVLTFLNQEIKDNSCLVLALSGGPDSMCLLHLLLTIQKTKNLKIVVAHVNHRVRKESDTEELFLKDYITKLKLDLEIKHFEEYKKEVFKEGIAREKRYNFLEEVVKKYQAHYLLTAHHGDDLMETILMRLSRGSNLKGYIGIKEKQIKNNYLILRPLLKVNKESILEYNKNNNIPYFLDKSNNNKKYTRNRYRLDIIPFLKKENSNINLKYYQFSKELEDYDLFITNYINEHNYIETNYLDLIKVKNESLFIKRKCLELLIRNVQDNDLLDISKAQLEEILKVLDKNGNKEVNLNNNYIALKEYNKLSIQKKDLKKEFSYIIDQNIYTDNWNILKEDNIKYYSSNNIVYLDSKELALPLIVRNRQNGDKMLVKNLNGHKKISDILIDEKVDISKREDILVVVDSKNEVIWVPSLKKSQFCKDKNEKYDIILKYEVKKK